MKRVISIFLTVAMFLTIVPTISFAAMGDYGGNITGATWYWPLHGYSSTSSAYSKITSSYGYRGGSYNSYHKGVDIGASNGTAVYSVRSGTVSVVDNSTSGSEGRSIIINHNDGYYSVYMHLSSISVSQGQSVNANTKIGAVGGSGYGSETYYAKHLHLGIHYGNSFSWECNVNPCPSGYTQIGNSMQASAGGYPIGSASISYSVNPENETPTNPKPPTNVQVSTYGTDVTVTWNASSNATYYDVYLLQAPWGWDDIKYSQTAYGTSCKFSGVATGDYNAFVIARPNSNTAQSEWKGFTVYPLPAAPTNVKANAWGTTNVTVTWNASTYATSYDVYLIQAPYTWDDVKYSYSTTGTSVVFNGVLAGNYHAFVVARPNDSSVQSAWYEFNVYAHPPEAPKVSVDSKYTRVGEPVTLSWNWPDYTEEIVYYLTEYPEGYAYTTNTRHGNIKSKSITFKDLPCGRYTMFVHASNSSGWGPQSNWISFYVYDVEYEPVYTTIYNDHIYALYDCEMSWSFARDLCSDMGGHLVTITSQEENDFIIELIDKGNKDAYWLGAYNMDQPTGDYSWVTGEDFSYNSWASGEPSSSGEKGEKEHFAEIRKSYSNKWNDVNNINKTSKGFIIEIEPSDEYITSVEKYNNSKYLMIDKNTTWTEAKAYCEMLGGHLVTVNSDDEMAFVNSFIEKGKRSWYYLGASKINNQWLWIDSNPANNIDWYETAMQCSGSYLMKYRFNKECIPLTNMYFPEYDMKYIGFICEIELPYSKSTVTKSGTTYTIETQLYNISEPCVFAFAGYKNGELVDIERKSQNQVSDNVVLNGDIDEIKVMVWEDLSNIRPICEAEIIPSSEFITE